MTWVGVGMTGQRFLDGWVINYNVFRPHDGLRGQTPAEAAEVKPSFKEWEDLAKPKARAFTRGKDFSEPVVTQRKPDRAFNPTRF